MALQDLQSAIISPRLSFSDFSQQQTNEACDILIYRVGQKKVSQKLMTITLSNLNGFSKFFQHLKENYCKLSTKPMLIKSYID